MRRVVAVEPHHHFPLLVEEQERGGERTFSILAKSFSAMRLPSIQVTSRSPQMFNAIGMKCRRVSSTMARCEKLVCISSLQ